MKFLQDPVEQEVVSVLTEIQALFSNIIKTVSDYKSKSMKTYIKKIENIPNMSWAELESLIAGRDKKFIADIVKNGKRNYSFLEENFKYDKMKALIAKEVLVKKAFYQMIPKINVEKFNEKKWIMKS